MAQPARVTAKDVTEKLGDDWDAGNPEEGRESRSVMNFIRSASAIIDRVATCAAAKGITLSDEELWAIEVALACGLYCRSDVKYQQRSTAGASGGFQVGQPVPGCGFGANDYEREALALDYSGCLAAIGAHRRASITWLGKPKSQQIPLHLRD